MSHVPPRHTTDEWLTPPRIINALGPFDLDPCSPPIERRPWPTAAEHYSRPQDGLVLPWHGRVWCNPPYGRALPAWVEKLAMHGNGIGLVFARTETRFFQDWVWPLASGMLFLDGRVDFFRAPLGDKAFSDGGGPSVLIAYDRLSRMNAERLKTSGLDGAYFDARRNVVMVPVAKHTTWREVVADALIELGGSAPLIDLYAAVERSVTTSNRHVRPKVRQILYTHEGRLFRRFGELWALRSEAA